MIDLKGKQFKQLFVIELSDRRYVAPKGGATYFWWCKCICGKIFEVRTGCLFNGQESCGCIHKVCIRTHGESSKNITKEYIAWSRMISRCEEESYDHYKDYGGRGIIICKEWRESFESFLKDMGRAPSPKHSLDRINVNGNYLKENCRWALKKVQARNTRSTVYITYNDKTLSLAAWAEEYSMDYKKLHALLKYRGMSLGEAISNYTPPITRKNQGLLK